MDSNAFSARYLWEAFFFPPAKMTVSISPLFPLLQCIPWRTQLQGEGGVWNAASHFSGLINKAAGLNSRRGSPLVSLPTEQAGIGCFGCCCILQQQQRINMEAGRRRRWPVSPLNEREKRAECLHILKRTRNSLPPWGGPLSFFLSFHFA